MKKISSLLLAIVVLSSCSDDEPRAEIISDAEAVDEIANSLATDVVSLVEDMGSTGILTQTNNTNGRLDLTIPGCGETVSQEVSKEFENDFVSVTYDANYEVSLECLSLFPFGLQGSFSTSSTSQNARFTTNGSSTGTVNVSLDTEQIGNYLLNAVFSKTGEFNQLAGDQKSFNSTSTAAITDLSVSTAYLASLVAGEIPTGNLVTSGSATYSVVGVNRNNEPYEYSAAIIFLGDGTAEVTINGTAYVVNLRTGEVIS